ncbi:MAG: glycosyltransferase family 39 protein, partial [Candidatus Micrarchaeaceae archaeon]
HSMIFGYAVTVVMFVSFIGLVAAVILGRRELYLAIRPYVNRYSLAALAALVLFFVLFSIFFVKPVEQLYFDENIYQGIALNILHNGDAAWCQFGTAEVKSCPSSIVYHDPVGWSFFIAIVFWLFGPGKAVAYNFQLFVGALSLIGIFLLSAVLFRRKDIPVYATAFVALNSEVFIWARTQAAVDLPFMMLTVFALFFFVVYIRRRSTYTIAMGIFSLVMVVYTRIEAFILVPLLAVYYLTMGNSGIFRTIKSRIAEIAKSFRNPTFDRNLMFITVLIVMLVPEILYIAMQAHNGNYGQGSGALVSIKNFYSNIIPNLLFLAGQLNRTDYYPVVFPAELAFSALVGAVLLPEARGRRDKFAILLFLGLLFFSFYIFYSFFYAGSVLYGVDVRFMLEVIPPLALLAGFGIGAISEYIMSLLNLVFGKQRVTKDLKYMFASVLVFLLAVYPFISLAHRITIEPQDMPQQETILNAVNFIYGNYTDVPQSCLVFSFTPDLWYTLNRSSVQIGYLGSTNATFVRFESQFSCFVIDYGYWCQVPPYKNTTCSSSLNKYKLSVIASMDDSHGDRFALYRILNYS